MYWKDIYKFLKDWLRKFQDPLKKRQNLEPIPYVLFLLLVSNNNTWIKTPHQSTPVSVIQYKYTVMNSHTVQEWRGSRIGSFPQRDLQLVHCQKVDSLRTFLRYKPPSKNLMCFYQALLSELYVQVLFNSQQWRV